MNENISVVIPHKNNSRYIESAIKSCILQIKKPNEVIIIDDHSQENEYKSLTRIISRQSCHGVDIILQKNKDSGIASALNQGIEQSKYDLVARMDADDISLPWRFCYQLYVMKKYKCDIIGSSAIAFRNLLILGLISLPRNHNRICKYALKRNPIIHPSILFKKNIILKSGYPIEEKFQGFEDYILWLRLLYKGVNFRNTFLPVILYRFHNGQFSRKQRDKIHEIRPEIDKLISDLKQKINYF